VWNSCIVIQLVKFIIAKGIKTVGGIRKGASGFDVTFVHPKSACGILLELVQAPKTVVEDFNKI
jgi:lactoylglutathione lyase